MATFGEAWPVAGVAVVATATTLELYDACVIMRDLHELDVAFNPEAAFGVDAQAVCGTQVPSKEEIWAKVKSSPVEAWAMAADAIPDPREIRNPFEGYEIRNPLDEWVIVNPFDGWEIRAPWE